MLGLDIQADPSAFALLQGLHQVDDFLQGGNLQAAIEARIARTDIRNSLDGAEGFQLGQREILAEPAGQADAVDRLGAFAFGEFGTLRHIGGQAEFVVVARDQFAVTGHDQVRFDVIRALQDRQGVGGEGVLREVATGAAVGDDQWHGLFVMRPGLRACTGSIGRRSERQQQAAGGQPGVQCGAGHGAFSSGRVQAVWRSMMTLWRPAC